ncbi:MAG: glucoamylase family protein [Treponemataceae bacterium]
MPKRSQKKKVRGFIDRFISRSYPGIEEPLRSELFSVEQMQSYSKILAEKHQLCQLRTRNERLLSRLVENESVLHEVRDLLSDATSAKVRIFPAADWLLDNFYLIEEHIRTSKRDLPKGYSRGLPRLLSGQSSGLPRVYDIALERISHGDGLVDPETLLGFLDSYQSVSVLTLGELWAIPIMMRLALIENLRRVAVRISAEMNARSEADSWADRMTVSAESDPKSLIILIADMARSDPPMISSFVAELARKLQGKGAALALPLTWIEQRLSEAGLTIDQLVQSSLRQQAADQVSIGNSIRSLRSLAAMDWRKFVESTSVVEKILREDPSSCYGKMDFATRDRYRHKVEELARQARLPEGNIAGYAIQLAREGSQNAGIVDRSAHVGFYLIDKGYPSLTRKAKEFAPNLKLPRNPSDRGVLALYVGSAAFLALLITSFLIAIAYGAGARAFFLSLMAAPAFLCAGGLALSLVNWVVTMFAEPRTLPRMDFSDGIPGESRTLVVVPAMLTNAGHIDHLVEALEIRFLANRDDNLFFGLLTDFSDAPEKTTPLDDDLIRQAREMIEELNDRYGSVSGEPFFLFHRERRWNAQERVWMGYERKRGKLADLNALLRGGAKESFDSIVGNIERLQTVKYVITLDTDTQLPRDSSRQLAGIMAHPLNRAGFDEVRGRVVEGYGILQPRVAASFPGANRSYFALLNDSEPGIDPYTRAVSDVYQDLFGEGSFIGKGIYDVDAFERSLKGRFPDNRILSHDLLEGCYARSGLVSDVQLFEDSPSAYLADVDRRRRWIRGDWQLLRWLFPTVPSFDGRMRKNALSVLSRWKILDNLRRSLAAPALVFLLIFGWLGLADSVLWTIAVVGLLFAAPLVISVFGLLQKSRDTPLVPHFGYAVRSSVTRLAQAAFALVCLPFDAFYSMGAIGRTFWRMCVTHAHLLEWKPSDSHERKNYAFFAFSFRSMWFAPSLAVTTSFFFLLSRPDAFSPAALFLALWFASPLFVWWMRQPLPKRVAQFSVDQTVFLGRLARKTWSYFETFVTDADHWLPPDNYQEVPVAKIAHRTSPTNIGLALLANLSAYDLGYVSAGLFLERTDRTLQSMAQLERYRSHFYNWYDTQTLQPLTPRYVSSVDSGNLAAHLFTLRSGLIALKDEKILSSRLWEGFRDTERILAELLEGVAVPALSQFRKDLDEAMGALPKTLVEARSVLVRLASSADKVLETISDSETSQAVWWAAALAGQVRDALQELDTLAPWLTPEHGIDTIPTLRELYAREVDLSRTLAEPIHDDPTNPEYDRLCVLEQLVREGSAHAEDRFALIDRLERQMDEFSRMDFTFLYSKRRRLLAIGYKVDGHRRDTGYYDLLASEARLASFIAIAQGQIPQENWFALGRLLADTGGKTILFSWSGSMFEYLMPLLVMSNYENTLLDQTCKTAVLRQIDYGRQRGVPWGFSESGYNSFDVGLNYQYRAFGVPGLGLKRGLVDDLVVAPYASALALLVVPDKACRNLQRLSAEGFEGDYGLYEAIDYTDSRFPSGQSNAVVRSFMAHHQGMSLLSFASHLLGQVMQKRFEGVPQVRATALLLEEKIPRATKFSSHALELPEFRAGADALRSSARVFLSPDTPSPAVHLLSNGRYHVMVTNAGGGYSRRQDIALTRWLEDGTADNWGTFLYVRDVHSGAVWSNSFQPTLVRPEYYEAIFSEGRAEFRRRDHDLDMHTEIAVSPEDDIELRRVRIANRSRFQRTIEITSYAEVVLASASSDAVHPGFSNLFVQTEILDEKKAILCTRRPRSEEEPVHWMLHLMTVRDAEVTAVSYETDRQLFLGRGNSVVAPSAMEKAGPLSGGQGSVLDPIVAIRQRIVIQPDSTATVDLVTGIADDRESALRLTEKYQGKRFANRAFELARTHSQVVLQQINGTEADAQLYGQLAGYILYAQSGLRSDSNVIVANRRGQSGLWGYAISGDLPIVLLRIKDPANIALVRQLVQAHSYWRQKGLAVDLVIWNEEHGGYRQQMHEQIQGLITAGVDASVIDKSGGIFVRTADQIANEDSILIQSVARAVISDSRGTLEEQIGGRRVLKIAIPRLTSVRASRNHNSALEVPRRDLLFFNGFGGFSPDGREYIITVARAQVTPAPWVNVIANPTFGTVVSESGMAYTWSENAHEFRLTPWHDDPVCDTSGEALYVRDEESGQFWSPSPLPRRGDTPYVSRHGFGYSVFEHSERGISTELWIYVAMDAPVKFMTLKVRNESGRTRRLSATAYAALVLGELRSKSAMHVVTEIDGGTGAVFARNWYNTEFSGRTVFLDAVGEGRTVTGDRTEFIGRNGTLHNPEAMARTRLSGRTGAALDPCAAIQIPFELADGQSTEIVFSLGAARDIDTAVQLVKRFRSPGAARGALEEVWRYWRKTLDAVHVETPDAALNVLANGWLLYEVLSCRMWGRSGYYQSGGAFGFRDQLQDAMALIHMEPVLVRSHLLLCASRQFPEGDVQHWWHPPGGRGSRTLCSDDYLWLPFAVCRYVACTGDTGVLDEMIPFIEGRPINPKEESYYDLPLRSERTASLYDHCVAAVMKGLKVGAHGLPLMGSGDWNDGMNLVGADGKGESVWLGFFLYDVLTRFSALSLLRDDKAFSDRCVAEAAELRANIEANAWDGEWYRRAYFGDGSPLGSRTNAECRIDSISQSWSVLSGAGNPERQRTAMDSMEKHLVRRDKGVIQLLDPPFDTATPNPGYIKGYVPGVRENGGQYTHAAIWAAMAFARMGENSRAWELLGMINPVNHSNSPETAAIYKAEPYVMSADVYSVPPHTGRGGWTWYTGSAGWMYRLIVESLLGISLEVDHLRLSPCLPAEWEGFKLHYRYRGTVYHITVRQTREESAELYVSVDGVEQNDKTIPLVDDHGEHQVEVRLSASKE